MVSLVLLATCSDWPDGEPGAPALDAALSVRGIRSRWSRWDDADVDWAAADLVAVRATWDYTERPGQFLAWARGLDPARLLNSADVFAWNLDKAYLVGLADLPAVPTVAADSDAGCGTRWPPRSRRTTRRWSSRAPVPTAPG